MSGPPDLEPEYTHEPDISQLPDRCHVATARLSCVKANKATKGGDRVVDGGVRRRCDCDVFRDLRENDVAIDRQV